MTLPQPIVHDTCLSTANNKSARTKGSRDHIMYVQEIVVCSLFFKRPKEHHQRLVRSRLLFMTQYIFMHRILLMFSCVIMPVIWSTLSRRRHECYKYFSFGFRKLCPPPCRLLRWRLQQSALQFEF